jgi:hypothetical protein
MTELASWITDGVSASLPWSRRRTEPSAPVEHSGARETIEADAGRYYEAHRSEADDRLALRGPIL